MSMSRCSSMVLTVNGIVGFVEDGRQLDSPTTRMMSGAGPPPGPAGGWGGAARPRQPRVASPGRALGVVGVGRPARDGADRFLAEPRLVQGLGVDGLLVVHGLGPLERRVDGG